MQALIRFFWQLCLLRRGPQDLPASPPLLGLMAVTNGLVGVLGSLDYFGTPGRAMAASLLDTLLVAGLVYATLGFAGHRPRFVQTLTAVYGVGVLFGAVMLVAQSLVGALGALPLVALINLIVLGWLHLALGHVLRHALEMDLWAGIAIAVGYTVIGLTLVNIYFPPAAVVGG